MIRAVSRKRMIATVAVLLAGVPCSWAEDSPPSFERDVRPILESKCFACHSDPTREASLDLRSRDSILKGGESGPAITSERPEESILWKNIADGTMPPEGETALTETEKATLRDWLRRGDWSKSEPADDPWAERLREGRSHWSLQAFRRPDIPRPAKHATRVLHPIDAFILARLERENLEPAPLADRATLIRRASFDLLGLPPSPEEVEAFVKDPSENAWVKLIDRLLESPHYGERWGRHWLDVARYADSGGYETDIYFKNAWRYRDYVVRAFNADRPYDRFVQEQIAGDELWADNLELDGSYVISREKLEHLEARLGTGFFALATQIHESNMDAKKLRNEQLTDWVDAVGSTFLGLTFSCARCHDHKFDPISQRDYYSMQAVFAGSCEAEIPIVNGMEIADYKQHYPSILAVDEARKRYQQMERSLAGRSPTDQEKQQLEDLKRAVADAVLALPEKASSTPNTPWDGLMDIPTATVLAHLDRALPSDVHLLNRGEVTRPKDKMSPALPEVLAFATNAPGLLPGPFNSRKELALWLTRGDHPLTARVMINRIWQWHFGAGIVSTPNDFGRMGQPPTHPELLDWLASEFVRQGWSVKAMHRAIMLSSTYQQSSNIAGSQHLEVDPDNKLLWRQNRRRLEGEAIWDAIHACSGTLNRATGGRPIMPPLSPIDLTDKAQWVVTADPSQHTRRGLYIMVRRNFTFPLFATFDAPLNAVSCGARDVTTVAPQALWMMNNQTAFDQSIHLAARIVREVGAEPTLWPNRVCMILFSRLPTDGERQDALKFLEQIEKLPPSEDISAISLPAELQSLSRPRALALGQLCLSLMNTSEFVFVD